jgi:hypothetical protein
VLEPADRGDDDGERAFDGSRGMGGDCHGEECESVEGLMSRVLGVVGRVSLWFVWWRSLVSERIF